MTWKKSFDLMNYNLLFVRFTDATFWLRLIGDQPWSWISELVQVSPPFRVVILRKGLWALEVADKFPTARVIGMDLSPIQPEDVPRNCEFVVGDLTQDLEDYNDGSMDLIHSRYTTLILY